MNSSVSLSSWGEHSSTKSLEETREEQRRSGIESAVTSLIKNLATFETEVHNSGWETEVGREGNSATMAMERITKDKSHPTPNF